MEASTASPLTALPYPCASPLREVSEIYDRIAFKGGAAVAAGGVPDRTFRVASLEAAVLDRSNGRLAFRRLADEEVDTILEP